MRSLCLWPAVVFSMVACGGPDSDLFAPGVGGSVGTGGRAQGADAEVPSADANRGTGGGAEGTGGAPVDDASASSGGSSNAGGSLDAGESHADGSEGGAPPGVRCGDMTCKTSDQACCLRRGTGVCVDRQNGCSGGDSIRLACDDSSDCDVGEVCCAGQFNGGGQVEVACRPTCIGSVGSQRQILCNPAVPSSCPLFAPQTCSENARALVQGYAYCHSP